MTRCSLLYIIVGVYAKMLSYIFWQCLSIHTIDRYCISLQTYELQHFSSGRDPEVTVKGRDPLVSAGRDLLTREPLQETGSRST